MEPEAINTLVEEAEVLREKIRRELEGNVPKELEYLFNDTCEFFEEEVLANWRRAERHDELIDYILYQYPEDGGADFWKQVSK